MKLRFQFALFLLILLSCNTISFAQQPNGGGPHTIEPGECVSNELRIKIEKDIEANRKKLQAEGILKPNKKTRSTSLEWPLRQAAGFDYCSYYGISNFVDHDLAFPNQVQDYNCGSRTYDLSSGYNHGGLDIFLWPFEWNMKNAGQVEIIAAAPGMIINKYDGNPDTSCNMNNPDWNAVFIQHADGSVAWYGHMKKGSLTTKLVGANVAVGEKIGLVGSSGSSTGPHLHFELHDAANNVLDPYAGTCNPIPTWWSTAKTYYEPTVNAAITHSQAPTINACPNPDIIYNKDTFEANDNIIFAGYFHDQLLGQQATYTIYQPDNTVFTTWTHSPTQYYTASYWYWTNTIPANPQYGTWKFSINLQGQICTHSFVVKDQLISATSNTSIIDQEFSLYPNPANQYVSIIASKNPIELYNIFGARLSILIANNQLNTADIPNGLYFIKSGDKIKKLVVQH